MEKTNDKEFEILKNDSFDCIKIIKTIILNKYKNSFPLDEHLSMILGFSYSSQLINLIILNFDQFIKLNISSL